MDTPITRAEHEEFRRTVNAEFDKLTAEDKRLNERLKAVEGINKQLSDMNTTMQKQSDNIGELSRNIASLTKARAEDAERLEKLEGRDGDMWRTVLKYATTVVVGALIGYVCTRIGIS